MPPWTDAQWRDHLLARLDERWERGVDGGRPWKLLGDYYEGRHRLQFATAKYREAFGRLFEEFADNWCALVVDALVERLRVQGIRYGKTADADAAAWECWQANRLDREAPQLWQVAVTFGEGYWLVDPPADGEKWPRVTVEHPSQVIVETDAGDRSTRLAALKRWTARDGRILCTLWLPDRIVRWEQRGTVASGGLILPASVSSGRGWEPRSDADHDHVAENPLGLVPVIPVANRPSMLTGGRSDIEAGVGLQDTINKLGTDMVVGSEFTAWPQRVLTGVAQPKDPDTGKVVPASELAAGANRLLMFANSQAKAQQWDAADPGRLVTAIDMWVRHFSAQTRTPPHYLLGQIVNASGDAFEAAEAGLKARGQGAMTNFGEPTEEMQRVCFLAVGDFERASRVDGEIIWGDPGFTSESAKVDAALKLLALGLPKRIVWERLGMGPTEIARAEAEAYADGLLNPGGLDTDAAVRAVADREAQKAGAAAALPPGPAQPAPVA